MKTFVNKIMIIIAITTIAVSCKSFSDLKDVEIVVPISISIRTQLNIGDAPLPGSLNVKLNNYAENLEYLVNAGVQGEITVNNIVPGVYTISVTQEVSQGGFTYYYSGSSGSVYLLSANQRIDISIIVAKAGALIFKEIFYCGSRTPSNGSYFRDQFYEIYNNSEVEQNVRNLVIALLAPSPASATPPIWPEDVRNDYVFSDSMWQVPDDKDYPLLPGESIIIAQMADNHQKESLNPTSPVNLITAEFETFVANTAIIQDNPAVNMSLAFWPSPTPQWLTTVFGGAYAIFNPKVVLVPGDPTNVVTAIGSTTQRYKIPISDVIDAVEAFNTMNDINLKRLPISLDGGGVSVGATYNGKSVSRKIQEVKENGRVIYFDTNNSTEDFQLNDTPVIRRNGAKAPAWNTWINNY